LNLPEAEPSGTRAIPWAKIKRQPRISLIWLVPLVAAVIGGWLVFEYFRQAGPVIRIQFSRGNAIEANQTTLQYRGVHVGDVLSVQLSDDAQHVNVTARLDHAARSLACAGSVFWIVHPEVGAGGLQGLETIVSGPYIQVQPGSGAEQRSFIGAEEPPMIKTSGELEIILTTPQLDELTVGSPVYYRGMEVGSVRYFVLGNDATLVKVHILIETNFAPLVRTNTQFWNAGGINLHLGLFSGISMNAETFKSLVIGGIAFATPPSPGTPAANDSTFALNAEADKSWLQWAPVIMITNAPAKALPNSPSSLLLNTVK